MVGVDVRGSTLFLFELILIGSFIPKRTALWEDASVYHFWLGFVRPTI